MSLQNYTFFGVFPRLVNNYCQKIIRFGEQFSVQMLGQSNKNN